MSKRPTPFRPAAPVIKTWRRPTFTESVKPRRPPQPDRAGPRLQAHHTAKVSSARR